MKYLIIAKELISGSFWNSMSLSEQGLLVNLLNKVPYKEITYVLYGREVLLQPNEVCFAQRRMAAKYNLSEYALKKMLHKFRDMGLITIARRKLSPNKQNNNSPFSVTPSHDPQHNDSITYVTSVAFCASVVAGFDEKSENRDSDSPKNTSSHNPFAPYKYTVFKNINNKLCVGANAGNQSFENPWYPLDAFANLTICDPEAWMCRLCEEVQTDSKTLTEAIAQFCKRQKDMGFNQMTKVFFSQQFIRYFNDKKRSKPEHNGKSSKPSAPKQLNEQPESEIDRQLKDLAAKRRRFGRNRSGGDDS